MDARTLEALRGSIAKWKAIEEGTGKDDGPENCPLCKLFFYVYEARNSLLRSVKNEATLCRGCPVMAKTGASRCERTPYITYTDMEDNGANSESLTNAARRERMFLESLLPSTVKEK